MNDMQLDPVIAQWLGDGPERGSEHGRNRALAAVHKVEQKAAWRFPQRWLPGPAADVDVRIPRQAALALLLVLTLLALVVLAVAFGGRIWHPPLVLAPSDDVIAFADGGVIYVAQPDGSDPKQVSTTGSYATTPVFSPDGTRVAYLALDGPGAGVGRLMIESVDGTSQRVQASQGKAVMATDVPNFSWSGDSSRIAFAAEDQGVSRIFIADDDADGGAIEPITSGPSKADLPEWSPDSQTIVYRSTDKDGIHTDLHTIYPITPDGTNDVERAGLIAPDAHFSQPRFFPDPDFDQEIGYAMQPGFGTPSQVVLDAGTGHGNSIWSDGVGGVPDWGVSLSPDGLQIAFLSADGDVIVADFDPSLPPYDGAVRDLGSIASCWVDWSSDGAELYGGSANSCDHLVVIPLENPESAATLPISISGTANWRPLPK